MNDVYGGTYRLFEKVLRAPGLSLRLRRPHRSGRASSASSRDGRRAGLGGDADEPAAQGRRHRRGRRASRTPPARCSPSTTRSPRRTCSSRSRSAPTSSCTRRRSTSAATRTSSAASRSLDDDALARAPALPAERDRRGARADGLLPGPARRSRRSPCGCARTARTPAAVAEWLVRATGGRRRCSTRACRRTRGHEVAARQMRDFGGMVSFRLRGGRAAVDALFVGGDTGAWSRSARASAAWRA